MSNPNSSPGEPTDPVPEGIESDAPAAAAGSAGEIGGRESGLDPTRYGDWEKNGRCIDF
jgi:hypothetical protein